MTHSGPGWWRRPGFPAVYMTGFGSSASRLGRPDIGLMTISEMVDNARRIVEAVDIPVIADADTGYGNSINVIRTVHEYEAAGVAAIHLEDQVMPKRCGHMEGKQVVTVGEMVAKVAAAVAARRSSDFLIIAGPTRGRSRGWTPHLSARARYREAGADVLFVEAPQSRGRDPGGGRGVPRRAAAVQLRRRRQDPAGQAMRSCASSASRS